MVHTTNLGDICGRIAYGVGTISYEGLKDNGQVQVLVMKPLAQLKPMIDGYPPLKNATSVEKTFRTPASLSAVTVAELPVFQVLRLALELGSEDQDVPRRERLCR